MAWLSLELGRMGPWAIMIAEEVIEELTVDEQEEVVDMTNARGIVTQGLCQ